LARRQVNEQDEINQGTWTDRAAVSWLQTIQGFTDEGERAAYFRLADEMRGKPILDLGVGAGRTITLLRALSAEYVAIDYLPVMVESARRRYPTIDVQLGDARDLSRFADESFSLVVFSYMGIDAVGREGRGSILREVQRVLKPGGIFWFSTLNMAGTAARMRPWRLSHPTMARMGLGRRVLRVGRSLKSAPRETLNYLRLRRLTQRDTGWMVAPFAAHSYRLLVHYTTLEGQLKDLQEAGFSETVDVFEDVGGAPVGVGDALSDVFCFNILARK
jgi:ubiquinone/menaquinone biosynthesis C-methylase UbiE